MCARKAKKSLIFCSLFLFASITSLASDSRVSGVGLEELLKQDSIVKKAKANFDAYARAVYNEIGEKEINYEAFYQGLTGYTNLEKRGELVRDAVLTIIDFSKPSNQVRLYIIDMCERKLMHRSLCAHGVNSGRLYPRHFSNETNSHKSSLGFYLTTTTYSGKFDLALRLRGMEHSNSHASSRGVVMHAAKYASYEFMEGNGCQLGRSYGCPALPEKDFNKVVNWIKGGSCLYIYYPSRSYKRYSKYLNRKNYLADFIEY